MGGGCTKRNGKSGNDNPADHEPAQGFNVIAAKINDAFAGACGDYQKTSKVDPGEGPRRTFPRALLVIAVFAAIVAVAVVTSLRAPLLYTKRVFDKDFTHTKDVFNVSSEGVILGLRHKDEGLRVADVSCPCRNRSPIWPSFTRWFLWKEITSVDPKIPLADSGAFCDAITLRYNETVLVQNSSETSSSGFNILCNTRLGYIIGSPVVVSNPEAQCTDALYSKASYSREACYPVFQQVDSNFLMDSRALNLSASKRILDSFLSPGQVLDVQQLDYLSGVFLDGKKTGTEAYNAIQKLVFLAIQLHLESGGHLAEVKEQAGSNLFPKYYYLFNSTIVVGMEMSWQDYFKQCNPAYCDVLRKKSAQDLGLDAIARLGGYVSIANLLLSALLWPALCSLLMLKPQGPQPQPGPHTAPAKPEPDLGPAKLETGPRDS